MAFLPMIEPGEADSEFQFFLDLFQPRAVLLLDPDRRKAFFRDLAETIESWGFHTAVFCPKYPGDHFLYQKDR